MVRYIQLRDGKKMPALGWGNGTRGIEHSGSKAVDLGSAGAQRRCAPHRHCPGVRHGEGDGRGDQSCGAEEGRCLGDHEE